MATADTKFGDLTESAVNPKGENSFVSDSLAFGIVFAISLTVLQRAVGFGRGILFCRLMTDQQLGQWSIVYSFLMLLAPLAVLGLPGCFGRFAEHYLQRQQLGVFVRRIALCSCCLTMLLAYTMYINPEFFSQLIFRSSEYTSIVNSMAFAVIMVAACNFLSSLMESLRQVRLATIMRFVQGVGFAIFATILLLSWEDASAGATLGFGLASFLACIPAFWFIRKHRIGFADTSAHLSHREMWSRIAPFAAWLWASNLVWNMFEVADRYMLVHWAEATAAQAHGLVGQYHSGRVIPMLLLGVAVVLTGMLMPYITVLWEKDEKEEASKQVGFAIKLIALVFTAAAIVICMFSDLLFEMILQGKYNDGQAVLPLTFLFSIWFSLCMVAQIYLWVAEKGKMVFAVTGVGLVLNFLFNALLIPQYEIWGAIGATTLATLFCLIATQAAAGWAGFEIDRKVWLFCSFPLIIILPMTLAIIAMIAILGVCCFTNRLLNNDDKQIVKEKLTELVKKIKG